MKKWEIVLLTLILGLFFVVRLYKYTNPIADWHSWRQADTSAVSRNFIKYGFDLLHPKFDDLSNVPSGIGDNPQGYRFVEFPFYNVLQAGVYMYVGHFTLEEWGRILTDIISVIGGLFLFLIVRRYANATTALAATFFLGIIPFNIYYDHTILPDPLMVTTMLGTIYFFSKFIGVDNIFKKFFYFFLAAVFAAVAFLIKPFAGFFFLPLFVMVWEKWKWKLFLQWQLYILVVLSIAPFAAWRIWMMQYPAGIPQSSWLFNSNHIRFTGAFFNWIFARRIGQLMLGYYLIGPFIIGIATIIKRKLFFFSFLASSFIYLSVVATGNVQHGYYQLPIIPSIAIFLGLGANFLIHPPKEFSRIITVSTLILCTLMGFAFSWFNVRTFFDINNPNIVVAGQAVDRLTPKNAKVIAVYDGDTSFLYQTNRQGWASFEHPLEEMVSKYGAQYMVLVNPTPNDYTGFGKQYGILASSSAYLIFDLSQKK